MRHLRLIFQEFEAIAKNKMILIPIIVVFFIPVLYAGVYLWAFLDPYSKLDQLPVAVVNLDKGTTYEGETLHAGNDLVKELKKNDSFKWEFVSLKDAKEGFDNQKFYMMIQIPENFSKNVTTITDKKPKQLELYYIPNESLNFLTAKMGKSAMTEIKSNLQKTITKAYAENVYKKVANGLQNAADGANELSKGSLSAKDGANQLQVGLVTLTKKSNEFKSGLTAAKDGSSQIANGLGALATKSPELNEGITQLKSGSIQLSNGLGELESKSTQMKNGVNGLRDGSTKLKTGLTVAKDGSTKLKSGLDSLNSGINQLQAAVENQLLPGANQLLQGSTDFVIGITTSSNGLNQLNASIPDLVNRNQQVSQGVSNLTNDLNNFQAVITALTAELPDKEKEAILAQYNKLIDEGKTVQVGTDQITNQLKNKVHPSVDKLAQGQQSLLDGANKLVAGQNKAVSGIATLNEKLKNIQTGASQLSTGSTTLNEGINQLSEGSNILDNGIGTLQTGSTQLLDGVSKLHTGSTTLDTGLGTLKSNSTQLISGVNALHSGSVAVDNGLAQLKNGSVLLVDGVEKLKNGSISLHDGLGNITDGTNTLKAKLKDSANEATQPKENDKELNMFSNPVNVVTKTVNAVPNYGTGLAPYFISLGLFVGALMISIVFPLRERIGTIGTPRTAIGTLLTKSSVLMVVGIMQAFIVDAVLVWAIEIEVQDTLKFLLFSIVVSWTFLAIIQFLITLFGDVGRFLAVVLLILQLTSSAGTYPVEMIPNSLQTLHAWMPMSYSVAGLKAVISSGDYLFMWKNLTTLLGFMAIMLIGTYGYYLITKKKRIHHIVDMKN